LWVGTKSLKLLHITPNLTSRVKGLERERERESERQRDRQRERDRDRDRERER